MNQTKRAAHAPTPWTCDTAGQPIIINGPDIGHSNCVAIIEDSVCGSKYMYDEKTAAANARFILRAVNAYDELIYGLEAIAQVSATPGSLADCMAKRAKAALAAAKAK